MSGGGSKKGEQRRRTLTQSEAVRAGQIKRMTRSLPLVFKGATEPKVTVLTVKQMGDVRVDADHYQRLKDVTTVNTLIHVLKQGGTIPDPITLARRGDGTLWIVDGQQRFWAHLECELPVRAIVYDVATVNEERELFIILNQTRTVNANVKVHAWPGPVAEYLRKLNERPESPLLGRINFGVHSQRTFGAATLARAMATAMTAMTGSYGGATNLLRRADLAWQNDTMARERARAYLDLAARVWPDSSHAKLMPMMALAIVVHTKWSERVVPVSDGVVRSLQRINWDALSPTYSIRFLPTVRQAIEQRWRST